MSSSAGVVVIGAGQAGGDLTTALRQQGYQGPITLIGDEPYPPYRRPPLSKQFLADQVAFEDLYLRSSEAYARQRIDCRFGVGVESIDRSSRCVRLFDGTPLEYEWLVLATGGYARRLAVPGGTHPNVHTVRTIDDIVQLKTQFSPGRRLLIVGGGFIGLEVAAVAVKKGLVVTVVEVSPRLLARVTAPEMSAFYERAHKARGVTIYTGTGVHALEGDPLVERVLLADGARLAADIVIVGIGLIPHTELAEAAGLEVSNGIVVDSQTRTADPAIFAIGDCSNHQNEFLGRRVRLESVPSALEQARVCAAAICCKPASCSTAPWFWSDQYDLKLQMVGLSQGYARIAIRGDPAMESFCVFYLKGDDELMAADAVNRPQEFMLAKKLVSQRRRVSQALLTDESVPLRKLIDSG